MDPQPRGLSTRHPAERPIVTPLYARWCQQLHVDPYASILICRQGEAPHRPQRARQPYFVMPGWCFGKSFLSISTHTHNPASQGRATNAREWNNTKGAAVSRSRSTACQPLSNPEQCGLKRAASNRALDQNCVLLGFSQTENN
jgi:hypothetical protein